METKHLQKYLRKKKNCEEVTIYKKTNKQTNRNQIIKEDKEKQKSRIKLKNLKKKKSEERETIYKKRTQQKKKNKRRRRRSNDQEAKLGAA